MGHLVWWLSMMSLWTGLKRQHSASDDKTSAHTKKICQNSSIRRERRSLFGLLVKLQYVLPV